MWLPWRKNSRRNSNISASFTRTSSISLKDILCDEEPTSPRKSSSAIFLRSLSAASAFRPCRILNTPPVSHPNAANNQIILYYTSFRVVRRTFEDCRTVLNILRGFRVAIDERDVSMDSRFLAEIEGLLGERKKWTLPVVCIGGRLIFGADQFCRLHENGELKKMVVGFPPASLSVCQCCGGVHFVLCQSCYGSHKRRNEKGGGFRSCPACNENGLARCPGCSR